jgi:hypothetical protein
MNFQHRVRRWVVECFGGEILRDSKERTYRFLEEALELGQAAGATKEDALRLVDYVYSRPPGWIPQEVGGILVTLAAYCECQCISMEGCGEEELSRCWKNLDKIRAKNLAKKIVGPSISPLPGNPEHT